MWWKFLDSIAQILQIAGLILAAPGLWIEHFGKQLEWYAARRYIANALETK